jgi:hypothetical protein
MHAAPLSRLHCSLKSLVVEIIPNTLEKIFPSGDPNITDYAAARRIPYLVAFGQLALPLLFQWVGVAECLGDRLRCWLRCTRFIKHALVRSLVKSTVAYSWCKPQLRVYLRTVCLWHLPILHASPCIVCYNVCLIVRMQFTQCVCTLDVCIVACRLGWPTA